MKVRRTKPHECGVDTNGQRVRLRQGEEYLDLCLLHADGHRDYDALLDDEGPSFKAGVARGAAPMYRRIARVQSPGEQHHWARTEWCGSKEEATAAPFIAGRWPEALHEGRDLLLR